MFASTESRLPLEGKRILLARPEEPLDRLGQELRRRGAEVLYQPAIRISPPADWQVVDEAIGRLKEFHWLVFSSVNGVRYFFERVRQLGKKAAVAFPPIATIGPGTAEVLAQYGLKAELVPKEFRAEALAEAIIRHSGGKLSGKRLLLVRGSRGRTVLAELLRTAGGTVEQVIAYQSSDVEKADAEIHKLLSLGKIDWIAVTSSAIAQSLARLFGEELQKSKLASISPITSEVLRQLGYEVAVEAEEYTFAGLTAALVLHEQRR